MWLLANTTPYAAERTWLQDKDANKIWFVALKATFLIQRDETCRLAEEQMPLLRSGEPIEPGVSLAYDADLLGVKACTDVLVRGNARSPRGEPVRAVDVGLRVGSIQKRLRVFGDRTWERGLGSSVRICGPDTFEVMPITYERAYGGWDRSSANPAEHRLESRNPVGTGFALSAQASINKPLPNVEYPDRLIESWSDRPPPAGFNAIDCHWTPRRELAGTYDDNWRRTRLPLWAEDFDSRYHNCAPPDQQARGFLAGGEGVEITNMSPEGTLRFRLPRVFPCFETRFGSERVEHRGQLCTVIIEPEFPRVMMVWQTALRCNDRVDELDATVITEKRIVRAATA